MLYCHKKDHQKRRPPCSLQDITMHYITDIAHDSSCVYTNNSNHRHQGRTSDIGESEPTTASLDASGSCDLVLAVAPLAEPADDDKGYSRNE